MIALYNGDCLELLKDISDKSVDLVVTDPPYEIHTGMGGGIYRQPHHEYITRLSDIDSGFSPEILDELVRVMKRINIYIFCSQKQIIPLLDYFAKDRGCNWNTIDLIKTNPVPACGNTYMKDKEFCLFFREKGVRLYGTYETKRTYFLTTVNERGVDNKKYGHPTVKPYELIQRLVVNSSKAGETVLDPFMGSGTTGAVCKQLGRSFIGMEINKEYFLNAKGRIEGTKENSADTGTSEKIKRSSLYVGELF